MMEVEGCETILPKPTVCESMPVVMVDYDVPVDRLNSAQAGQPFTFTVDAARPKGWTGSMAMAGAEYRCRTTRCDVDTYHGRAPGRELVQGTADAPALANTNGFVTLKAEAWDADGNRTVQTITRAYALK